MKTRIRTVIWFSTVSVGFMLLASPTFAAVMSTVPLFDGDPASDAIDGQASADWLDPATGVTLTFTVTSGESFNDTGNGLTIRSTSSNSRISPGDSFTITFTLAGTIDSIGLRGNDDSTSTGFTVSDFDQSVSVPFLDGTNTVEPIGISFAAGEAVTFRNDDTVSMWFQSVTYTAIPEPASLVLLAAGGALMLNRRRK